MKSTNKVSAFLKKKDIEISSKRYLQEALGAMALGLFASLLIGLIIKTLGEQTANLFGENPISLFLVDTGVVAMGLMGAGVGVAVSWALKAPPMVLFAGAITGMMGASLGGPAGAFLAAALGAEFGKLVSKETKIDIIVTPAVTLIVGMISATVFGPLVDALMTGLGQVIMTATEMRPFVMGIIVAVIVGLALTAPISSAALCIMLGLGGLAAGAATVGCCAQMVGFAINSYKDNGVGGLMGIGIGTSMLQIANIIKNPWILIPPTLTGAILGPVATVIFQTTNIPIGAGMGTSGFVGQIGTFTSMGFTLEVLGIIVVLHLLLPGLLSFLGDKILRKMGKINKGDYTLDV